MVPIVKLSVINTKITYNVVIHYNISINRICVMDQLQMEIMNNEKQTAITTSTKI